MPQRPDVQAAGAVVTRKGGDVLIVHRPRYDDWSFPKGKLNRGEHVVAAAVREVGEETGLRIRLGPRLPDQRYLVGRTRSKQVHYWMGRVVGDDDVSGYQPNAEIDQVRWVSRKKARKLLHYEFDRETLATADELPRNSRALIVLRHAKARARKAWKKDDRLRPLLKPGELQAQRLVPLLAAYDVSLVTSSSSTRCVQTVAPYAERSGWPVTTYDGLSEEGASHESVLEVVDDLLHHRECAMLCTHRPVLPTIYDVLRLDEIGVEDPKLDPAQLLVVHHRRGRVVAVDRH
jgi:8-oxo-(d)GTP phosphatase